MNNKEPIVIGLIYYVDCIHCQLLMPEWNKMKKNIQSKYKDQVVFKEFEREQLDELDEYNMENAEKFKGEKITFVGFPTCFKIINGNIEYYEGERTADVMEKWFMNIDNKIIKGGRRKNKTRKNKNKRKIKKSKKSRKIRTKN